MKFAKGGPVSLLTKTELVERLNTSKPEQIFIEPLLSDEQIGAVSVDMRLGYDFLVSVVSHKPSISLAPGRISNPETFFQPARRDIGDVFLLHPSQTVLATTLEYIGLPNDIYADVISRSSYHRLGVSISSMFQPGFRGCVSLELFNHSNIPIELIVGSRIVQARFFKNQNTETYSQPDKKRKYIGHVRPTVSRATLDDELSDLIRLSKTESSASSH